MIVGLYMHASRLINTCHFGKCHHGDSLQFWEILATLSIAALSTPLQLSRWLRWMK